MHLQRIAMLAILAIASCSSESTTSAALVSDTAEPICNDDGECTTCTDDVCSVCDEYGCTDCDEYWSIEFNAEPEAEPEDEPEDVVIYQAPGPPQFIIQILANGDARVLDPVTRNVLYRIPGFATLMNGQWVVRWNMVPAALNGVRFITEFAHCLGPIAVLIAIAGASYAGVDAALGPAAGAIGIRLQDCKDRFTKAAAGIACLQRQGASVSCGDAVAACPDAFVGANLVQSCGDEPLLDQLLAELAAAIATIANHPGGSGTQAGGLGAIKDAIRMGTFATNPATTCTMRARVQDCEFKDGDVFPAPASFTEAKKCWEDASRGIFESKYEEALKCCTTAQCKATLWLVKDC